MTIKEEVLRKLTMDEFSNTSLKVIDLTLKKVEEKIDNLLKSQVKNIPRFELEELKQKLRGGE